MLFLFFFEKDILLDMLMTNTSKNFTVYICMKLNVKGKGTLLHRTIFTKLICDMKIFSLLDFHMVHSITQLHIRITHVGCIYTSFLKAQLSHCPPYHMPRITILPCCPNITIKITFNLKNFLIRMINRRAIWSIPESMQ